MRVFHTQRDISGTCPVRFGRWIRVLKSFAFQALDTVLVHETTLVKALSERSTSRWRCAPEVAPELAEAFALLRATLLETWRPRRERFKGLVSSVSDDVSLWRVPQRLAQCVALQNTHSCPKPDTASPTLKTQQNSRARENRGRLRRSHRDRPRRPRPRACRTGRRSRLRWSL